jgi:hypothetical protein
MLLAFLLYDVFWFQVRQKSVNVSLCEKSYKTLLSVQYFLNYLSTFNYHLAASKSLIIKHGCISIRTSLHITSLNSIRTTPLTYLVLQLTPATAQTRNEVTDLSTQNVTPT